MTTEGQQNTSLSVYKIDHGTHMEVRITKKKVGSGDLDRHIAFIASSSKEINRRLAEQMVEEISGKLKWYGEVFFPETTPETLLLCECAP